MASARARLPFAFKLHRGRPSLHRRWLGSFSANLSHAPNSILSSNGPFIGRGGSTKEGRERGVRAHSTTSSSSSVDYEEVEKFSKLAERWWDPDGPQAMLHLMNPARIGYIRQRLSLQLGTQSSGNSKPLQGLKILDIGCGGGFASESLAKLGADVLGVDASEEAIEVAIRHGKDTGLIPEEEANSDETSANSEYKLRYQFGYAETLADQKLEFDVVTALDIIEHVPDQTHFLCTCLSLVKPGGAMFVCTMNRTSLSYALAVVGAEYVFRFVPTGTHDWNKFVTPDELRSMVNHYEDYEVLNSLGPSEDEAAMVLEDVTGIKYDPFKLRWGLDPNDTEVNYIAHISKN